MAENKKDIIIQVEIASNIYTEIGKLKKELETLTPGGGKIDVTFDTSKLKNMDWSKDLPQGLKTLNIKSSLDKGFHINIKNAKQALKSLQADAMVNIKIAPIDAGTITKHDWSKLAPPDEISDKINILNKALGTLSNRLTSRKVGGKGGTTKSLADIINETSAAFTSMASAATLAASAVGGIKTAGIASDPTKVRGGGKGKKAGFDIGTFNQDIQDLYGPLTQGANEREIAEINKVLQRSEAAKIQRRVTDTLARNNQSGMQDMGGIKHTFARAFMWGGAASVVYGAVGSLRKAVDITVQLENEMTQLKKVMSDSTPFDEMKSNMFDLASAMGVSITQVTKLAKIWAQQGYDMVDTMKLAVVTIDTMNALNVDSAMATDFLTSVTRVWSVELDELQKVLSSVMRVQADYAIESEDLAQIFTRIGSGVKEAGDSMAFLAGVSTALRESTRKTASQIFTSLKTIYAKSFSDEVVKALSEVGVFAKSSVDQFRPFGDILRELAGKWNTLNDVQRKSLAITIGQTRYWSDFVAIMENFNIVENATLSFYRAWNDASKASELQQKSLKNTLQGVSASFIKIGDTFGTKFFAPLIQSLSAPIKAFADIFASLGSVQSGLVFAGTLALIKASFKSMLGAFPAYEKFLGRTGLAGKAFTTTLIAQRHAMVAATTVGKPWSSTLRVIGSSLAGVTGNGVSATASINALSVAMTRFSAISKYIGGVVFGIGKSLLSFGAWTAGFFILEKAISGIISLFKEAKSESEEFFKSLPVDVLQKINSLGLTDQKTGKKITAFVDVKKAIDELLPKLLEKQKELSTAGELHTLTWEETEDVISTLSTNSTAVLLRNYADLTKSVESQKKLWEDIQTSVAITQNLVYGDAIKMAEEFRTKISQGFTDATSGAQEFGLAFKEITGLTTEDLLSPEITSKAIEDNIEKIINDPRIIKGLKKASSAMKDKVNLGAILDIRSRDVARPGGDFARQVESGLQTYLTFFASSAQKKVEMFEKTNPIQFGFELGKVPMDAFGKNVDEARKYGEDTAESLNIIGGKINVFRDEITKLGDIDKLKISTTGADTVLGKLFVVPIDNATKALGDLESELKKIELFYNASILSPEDILKEQEKAYRNYSTNVINEFIEANNTLDKLQKDRDALFSTIKADPNLEVYMKKFDSKKQTLEQFFSQLEVGFNESIEGSQEGAAGGNNVLAQNLKLYKTMSVDIQAAVTNVQNLSDAYRNLGQYTETLSKLTMLLEKQALIDKLAKSNREFLSKQSVDYLKQELSMQEEISKLFIDSESQRASLLKDGYKEFEKIKEKELALHRFVAMRKTEIDFEERKKQIIDSQKPFPKTIDTGIFGKIHLNDKGRAAIQKMILDNELENNQENLNLALAKTGLQEDMYDITQRIIQSYSIWNDYSKSVLEKTQFIRDTLASSLTDFARINETHGLSVLTDTIGKIGKRFQEEQAKIFVNSVISSKIGAFVLPSEEDLKFTERLNATSKTFYDSIYTAMHNSTLELAAVMGYTGPTVNSKALEDRQKMEAEAASLGDVKKAANIAAIGNFAAMMGLSFIGGNDANKQQGAQIGSMLGAILPKLLFGANPVVASLVSVASLFAGGAIGSLFGGKAEQKQDTMISQLKLIEQNTARAADLAEKMLNIPGSVFLPPTGGFVIQGGITINADGIKDPQAVVDMTMNRISQEYGLAARRSGDRARF